MRRWRKRQGTDTWHLCSNCSNWPTSDYGWCGALASATHVGILLGPVPAATGMAGGVDQLNAWAIRGVMVIAVGVLTGALVDRSRAALRGVQLAAVEIAQRQRDGMVAPGASS